MKKDTILLYLATAILAPTLLLAAEPSADSVKELLQLAGSPQMIEMSKGQIAGAMQGPIQQALQGKAMTPEIGAIVEAFGEKSTGLINAQLTWESVEPIFVEIYQSTMTAEEVDGIVAFYKTPAGKAMVEKLPQLTQTSGQRMQQQMAPLVQQLQQLQQETLAQLQAEFAKGM